MDTHFLLGVALGSTGATTVFLLVFAIIELVRASKAYPRRVRATYIPPRRRGQGRHRADD